MANMAFERDAPKAARPSNFALERKTMLTHSSHESAKRKTELRISYVEKQIVPWLIGHLQTRSTGLQVFVAIQGALMVAYATSHTPGLIALGMASAFALLLWDTRNRDVFTRLHTLAEEIADREIFGVALDGTAKNGLHRQALGTLATSGSLNPDIAKASGLASHTWAIRIIAGTSFLSWASYFVVAYAL